jgi:hypothetical protein
MTISPLTISPLKIGMNIIHTEEFKNISETNAEFLTFLENNPFGTHVYIGPRRSGITTMCITAAIWASIMLDSGNVLFLTTNTLTREIGRQIVHYQNTVVNLYRKAPISVYGYTDNYKLRGKQFDVVVCDNFGFVKKRLNERDNPKILDVIGVFRPKLTVVGATPSTNYMSDDGELKDLWTSTAPNTFKRMFLPYEEV